MFEAAAFMTRLWKMLTGGNWTENILKTCMFEQKAFIFEKKKLKKWERQSSINELVRTLVGILKMC